MPDIMPTEEFVRIGEMTGRTLGHCRDQGWCRCAAARSWWLSAVAPAAETSTTTPTTLSFATASFSAPWASTDGATISHVPNTMFGTVNHGRCRLTIARATANTVTALPVATSFQHPEKESKP